MKQQIIDQIKRLFGDTSKPEADTLDELMEIRDEVDQLIACLGHN